jgi:hypothetical protein
MVTLARRDYSGGNAYCHSLEVLSMKRELVLLLIVIPFVLLIILGAIAVLLASTVFFVEGEGRVFYGPLGGPGIIAILAGLVGVLSIGLLNMRRKRLMLATGASP